MVIKRIIYGLIFFLLAIFQISFLKQLNPFWSNLDLVLIALVLLINLSGFSQTMVFALGVGLLWDIYSGLPFGFFMLNLLGTAIILTLLFFNFFTNRSSYSLLLMGFLAVLFNELLTLTGWGLLGLVGGRGFYLPVNYWPGLFWHFFNTMLSLGLAFSLINRYSKAFKPIFIK